MFRFALFTLTVALTASVPVRAADDHPFKSAKAGDSVTYTTKAKALANMFYPGTRQLTVTSKSGTEVTVTTTGSVEMGGIKYDAARPEMKIDLDKPFDPSNFAQLLTGTETKVETGKSAKEKIKAGGKEYDCTRTAYTIQAKHSGMKWESRVTVWVSKDVPLGIVKVERIGSATDADDKWTMELKEIGTKK